MAALDTTRAHQPTSSLTPSVAAGKDVDWLLRYARHGPVKLDTSQSESTAVKSCFTPAAWRLVCRSPRDSFLPILNNRRLCFDSLVHYTQALVENGFQLAPSSELLDYFIQSSYYFFDRMPEVPDSQEDMTLLRLATRHGVVSRKDFQRVHAWNAWTRPDRGSVTTRMTWPAVLRRANDWHLRQQLVVEHAKANNNNAGWHFACGALPWRGYEITPLANDIDLWDEGQAMSNCLYQLRNLCQQAKEPSRFFSVKMNGRRYATLELVRDPPHAHMHGRWRLQDLRLSHNRMPSEGLVKMLTDFGGHYNTLSQRPGRATKAQARP